MNEKLLQYLWNYKIFKSFDFKDMQGNSIEILDFGTLNQNAGPDYLNAKIKIGNLIFAGNIELHLRSSDWIFHQHSGNPDFENIILHVVFQHDSEIDELSQKNIPTLELKNFIDSKILAKHENLLSENQFIPCEKIFDAEKIPFAFAEENLLQKLNEKSQEIEQSLQKFKNNYEAVLFHYLAYAFGLKVNAQIFKQMAESINFRIIQKVSQNQIQLESLFFGKANWLENPQDETTKIWKKEYDFLKLKFQLSDITFNPKFLRLRPQNFPTIRLSQLANLYHFHTNLFSRIIKAKSIIEVYKIFGNVKASDYWNHHFNFGKISTVENEKKLTKDFIDLLLLNAILPIKYTYHKNNREEIAEEILEFYLKISAEKNVITENWKSLKVPIKSSLESQAYIYHFKNFCTNKKCLNCSIGLKLLQ